MIDFIITIIVLIALPLGLIHFYVSRDVEKRNPSKGDWKSNALLATLLFPFYLIFREPLSSSNIVIERSQRANPSAPFVTGTIVISSSSPSWIGSRTVPVGPPALSSTMPASFPSAYQCPSGETSIETHQGIGTRSGCSRPRSM